MKTTTRDNMRNEDVPESAIIKQLLIENGKLKSEIAYLESELKNKNEAIKAFKQWQTKVAEYKYHYWLNKGLELLQERPSEKLLYQLRSVLGNHATYGKLVRTIEGIIKRFDKFTDSGLLKAELERVEKLKIK